MQDLTQGSIPKHLLGLAAPIAVGMFFQTLHYLIDLFFVGRLGEAAIAGVSAAGTVQFIVLALTQILGVGTMALIAHAVGQKNRDEANLIFNQSLLLAALCALIMLGGGYGFLDLYMKTLGADPAATQAGAQYLRWYLPALALTFAQTAMGSALRGTGIAKPTMVVQVFTVVLNAIFSPILIAGWLTGRPLGTMGAGLGSSIAVGVGVVLLALYFVRLEKYVAFDPRMFLPRLAVWRRILKIGLPPGGEFALMFIYMAVIYRVLRDFGATAQAGFGIGSRVLQAILLPAMAVSFATGPVAGQNFGAGLEHRVRASFRYSAWIGAAIMGVLTILCQWRPEAFIGVFSTDLDVVAVGSQFMRIISLNFIASGLVFTCSGMFQALGNTIPGVLSTATRLVTFVVPLFWLARQSGFELVHIWYLSVATVGFQAVVSMWFLHMEFRHRLG